MKRTKEITEMRRYFRPKRPELPKACASCPFRDGNDAEFKVICDKLGRSAGLTPVPVNIARARIRMEVDVRGDFICHGTAYDKDINYLRLPEEYRQCPGATRWFKTGKATK